MLNELTLQKAHNALTTKQCSAEELTKACFDRIHDRQSDLKAFITLMEDSAYEQARLTDAKIARGEKIGVLEGVPCALKDNILVKDEICTAGSKMLKDYRAPYDATVIDRLRKSGSIFLGKTNMDEFAMGSSTENSFFGSTKNPYDMTRVTGGSSGGSAAAVADNQSIYSLGSDTGGSIRQPAAFCGLVGLKPTYGRVSRYGLIAMTSSFDQIGPLTKNITDSAIVFDAIYGHDKHDLTTISREESEPFSNINVDLRGKRIGYSPDIFVDGMDEEIKKTILDSLKKMENAGAEIVIVDIPHLRYALAAYYLIVPAEISSNLARFDGLRYGNGSDKKDLKSWYESVRAEGFGKEVQRRIILGTYVLSSGYYDAYYKRAQKLRGLLINEYNEAFRRVDCMVTPTTPSTAFSLGSHTDDPLTMYLEDIYTVSINVVGVPAISMPCGFSSHGLPIGIQFIAPHFGERALFSIGAGFESL